MGIKNALAGVAVADLDVSAAWYAKVIGSAGNRPMPEVAEWQLESGGALQVFRDAKRAGQSSVTLVVGDRDREITRLKGLGIAVGETHESNEVDTAFVADPDGNRIVLAQPKGNAVAR